MLDTFPIIRFSQSAALWLTVGLVTFAGCRWLSPKNSTTPYSNTPAAVPPRVGLPEMAIPQIGPQTASQPGQKADEPDIYSAFRPLMPEELRRRIPVKSTAASVPPKTETSNPATGNPASGNPASGNSDIAFQSKIDELNQRIAKLEIQLEEAKKMPPQTISSVSSASGSESAEKKESKFKTLPVINKPDITAYWDESQNVRIEVADKALFMPDAWQLTAEGEETLRMIAAEIRATDAKAFLDIEGHTDSLMSDPNNPMQKHDISTVKAKEVMDFFVNTLRWDITRIRTSSFGRSRPVADNGTPEGRARNNRIEIVVQNE